MNGTKISDAEIVKFHLKLFLGGDNYENKRDQLDEICFRRTNMS